MLLFLTVSMIGKLDEILLGKTATPNTTVVSWTEINDRNPNLLNKVTELLETGITPDELEDTNYTKYHHRTGINSYLSENYTAKFYYDGEEWPTVQHAYQVFSRSFESLFPLLRLSICLSCSFILLIHRLFLLPSFSVNVAPFKPTNLIFSCSNDFCKNSCPEAS